MSSKRFSRNPRCTKKRKKKRKAAATPFTSIRKDSWPTSRKFVDARFAKSAFAAVVATKTDANAWPRTSLAKTQPTHGGDERRLRAGLGPSDCNATTAPILPQRLNRSLFRVIPEDGAAENTRDSGLFGLSVDSPLPTMQDSREYNLPRLPKGLQVKPWVASEAASASFPVRFFLFAGKSHGVRPTPERTTSATH